MRSAQRTRSRCAAVDVDRVTRPHAAAPADERHRLDTGAAGPVEHGATWLWRTAQTDPFRVVLSRQPHATARSE